MKDRTKQEPSDPTLGRLPDDAERLGIDSTQRGGKHGEAPAETETWLEQVLAPRTSGSSCITEPSRKSKLNDLTGTARCGAACRVVWEG